MKKSFFVIFGLLFGISSAVNAALVGHWQFDETSGTTAGCSVNSANDGTLTDSASFDNGSLLSTNDVPASVGVNTNMTGILGYNARTVAAWIKTDASTSTGQAIVSWGTSWAAHGGGANGQRFTIKVNNSTIGNGNELRVEIGGGFTYGSIPINDGQWNHIAIVMDGTSANCSDIKLYVNGVLDTNVDSLNTATINSMDNAPVAIGWVGVNGVSSQVFMGNIDDVRIYDSALSGVEVAALVPEPASMMLIGLGGIGLLGRKRR